MSLCEFKMLSLDFAADHESLQITAVFDTGGPAGDFLPILLRQCSIDKGTAGQG